MKRAGYEGVAVAVPVTIPYVRYSIRGAHWWIGRAMAELCRRGRVRKEEIDGLCVASFTLTPDVAVGLTQHLGMSVRWLDHVPLGGGSAVVSLRRAARAVQSGDASIVACVAGDANHVDSFRLNTANFSLFARDAVYAYGSGGTYGSFAFLTEHYMRKYGATREDFGKLCVAQRQNALRNANALFKKPLTMEEYLNARPLATPVHLFDAVMPCAGADAFLVMRSDEAEARGLPWVRLLGTMERLNAFPQDAVQERGGWALDRDEAQFVRSHTFTTDGSFPFNTGGGQLSVGQAGAAGGHLGVVEALRQLTGEYQGGAVKDAEVGLVSGFGMINYDRGLCSGAAILAAGKRLQ
ncbi:MAG: thiolase family protein [Betaproteobacteria bacterium]|nr:thiolase family protein [Betaproteobacteria bacterium]